MVPKKAKDLYKITAEQLGISEDLVKDAVEIYWSDVRKALTEMQHHVIFIDSLGQFSAKETKLKESLEKYERLYGFNDGSTYRKMAMKKELGLKIERIKKLLGLIQQDKEKKQLVKDKRDGKLNNNNLEEQVANSGRSEEPDIQEGARGTSISEEDEDM